MRQIPQRTILIDIVEEHFEELDFLWEKRASVLFAPNWTLRGLAELEERAEAHLDGLCVAGDAGIKVAKPALAGKETGAAAAATFTLMATGAPPLTEAVAAAFETGAPEAREGIRSALRHCELGALAARLESFAASSDPGLRLAACDVLAFQRRPLARAVLDLVSNPHPAVARLALGVTGRTGGRLPLDAVRAGLSSPDPGVRSATFAAAARSGSDDLPDLLRTACKGADAAGLDALTFLGALGQRADQKLLESSVSDTTRAPAALAGLGAMGRISCVPTLLAALSNPKLAPHAAAAFARLTGAFGGPALLPPPPAEPDPDATPVELPPPEALAAWWKENAERFPDEGRWQCGSQVPGGLGAAFRDWPLAVRRDVYLAKRVRGADKTPDLELEAKAKAQLAAG